MVDAAAPSRGDRHGDADSHVKSESEHTESTLARVRREAASSVKSVVHPVLHVFERAESQEGTALRKRIASARVRLNQRLDATQRQLEETTKAADKRIAPVKSVLSNTRTRLTQLNEFRRDHPNVALAGLVAAVGVPSLVLRGKWIACRNILVVAGAGVAAAYTNDRLSTRPRK